MKRTGHLFEKIVDIDNIKTAARKASLGKRHQKGVQRILMNLDHYASRVQEMLIDGSFSPSPYAVKRIIDGTARKEREISKPRFYPDQIVHWAIMLQVEPLMMRGMYYYNCGSIPGRGASRGQKAIRKWLNSDHKGTKYCLKLDISKFYPSVDNSILKAKFRRIIKDGRMLRLLDQIVDSATGLPIGNYTSQWFANFFLTDLDHFIKGLKGAKHYTRYVDDLVILGPNKRALHRIKVAIDGYLKHLRLQIKSNWQVFKTSSRAIDFLGLKFYPCHTTLRRKTSLRVRRRAKKVAKKSNLNCADASAMISYWGWIKRSNSYRYYHQHIKPYIEISKCRKVVSSHAKANHHRASTSIRPTTAICC